MNWRPFCLAALLCGPSAVAQASSDPCLQAVDYKGCKEYQDQTGSSRVKVDAPKDYDYEPESVRQQQIRAAYGWYLTFVGIPASLEQGNAIRSTALTTTKPLLAGRSDT